MIDVKQFWQAIGQRATGSTIVTARADSGPAGLLRSLGNACLRGSAHHDGAPSTSELRRLPAILQARHFALNYLSSAQRGLRIPLAGNPTSKAPTALRRPPGAVLATGAPTLADAVGVIDCELVETIERYDVVIILGRVVATSSNPDRHPWCIFAAVICRDRCWVVQARNATARRRCLHRHRDRGGVAAWTGGDVGQFRLRRAGAVAAGLRQQQFEYSRRHPSHKDFLRQRLERRRYRTGPALQSTGTSREPFRAWFLGLAGDGSAGAPQRVRKFRL